MGFKSVNTHGDEHRGDRSFKVFKMIESFAFDCYLTGSRYFNLVSSYYSDWDFFAPRSKQAERELVAAGFEELEGFDESYTADPNIAKVYRHNDLGIDVQLVIDLKAKLFVNEMLYNAPESIRRTLTLKSMDTKAIWKWLFKVYTEAHK